VGNKAVIAFILCALPVTLGFLLPAGQLLVWGLENLDTLVTSRFINLFWHSIWLAGITAIVAITIALFVGYAQRSNPDHWIKLPIRVASMGYAIPGVVIAVGVMIPFAWFDNHLSDFLKGFFDIEIGLLLSNSVFILIFAYLVRFLSISIQSVEAGLGKIKTNMDDAARALKARPIDIVRKIHLPVMRGSLLTALLLVFVDVLKELPATLVLRPFDFNTLAIRAYELASDERLSEASIPSLAIVVAGLIPVIILNRSISQSRPGLNKP
jgi:iron(III) transport system permease protein